MQDPGDGRRRYLPVDDREEIYDEKPVSAGVIAPDAKEANPEDKLTLEAWLWRKGVDSICTETPSSAPLKDRVACAAAVLEFVAKAFAEQRLGAAAVDAESPSTVKMNENHDELGRFSVAEHFADAKTHAQLRAEDPHATVWKAADRRRSRYGAIVVDPTNEKILLREPTNHFQGFVWTFARGGGEPGEHPLDVALRETKEETGYTVQAAKAIPEVFHGATKWSSLYYIAKPVGKQGKTDWETSATKWCTYEEAKALIGQTTNDAGRKRDLQVLDHVYGKGPAKTKVATTLVEKHNENHDAAGKFATADAAAGQWVNVSIAGADGETYKVDGGRIDVQFNTKFAPRKQSVIDFVVDEDKRGQGIGDRLLKAAMSKYADLGAQVSSAASLKVFHNNGFRSPDLANGSFADHLAEFKANGGSLFVAANDKEGKPYVTAATAPLAEKGDVAGHEFHGNQYTGGLAAAVDNGPLDRDKMHATTEWNNDLQRECREYGYTAIDLKKINGLAIGSAGDPPNGGFIHPGGVLLDCGDLTHAQACGGRDGLDNALSLGFIRIRGDNLDLGRNPTLQQCHALHDFVLAKNAKGGQLGVNCGSYPDGEDQVFKIFALDGDMSRPTQVVDYVRHVYSLEFDAWMTRPELRQSQTEMHRKGDVEGHAFHGNQWTGGGGERAAEASASGKIDYAKQPLAAGVAPVKEINSHEYRVTVQGLEKQLQQAVVAAAGPAIDASAREMLEKNTVVKLTKRGDRIDAVYGSETARRVMKQEIVKEVGARLLAKLEATTAVPKTYHDLSVQQKLSLFIGDPSGPEPGRLYKNETNEQLAMTAADQLVRQWAESSSDSEALSLAVQETVRQRFGCQGATTPAAHSSKEAVERAKSLCENHSDVLKMYVEATYESTQAQLKAAGITELMLYRGMHFREEEKPDWLQAVTKGGAQVEVTSVGRSGAAYAVLCQQTAVKLNPLSSFCANQGNAQNFAAEGAVRVVLATRVKAERIFSTFWTGPGCMNEDEVTIIAPRGRDASSSMDQSRMMIFDRVAEPMPQEFWRDPPAKTKADGDNGGDVADIAAPAFIALPDDLLVNADWPKRTDDRLAPFDGIV